MACSTAVSVKLRSVCFNPETDCLTFEVKSISFQISMLKMLLQKFDISCTITSNFIIDGLYYKKADEKLVAESIPI